MTEPNPDAFDSAAAHRRFSAHCFNDAWTLLEMPDRTPDDDRLMIETALASIYHWRQRPDCSPANLSIGYWQASRVHAVLGLAVESQRYAEASAECAEGLDPFLVGYAHEALARAATVAGRDDDALRHLALADAQAQLVDDAESRTVLVADLDVLRALLR